MLRNLMVREYFSAIAASFNPTVERDWPKSGFFAVYAKLNILGSCHFLWSASPSLLR
jgi:hypothetical protein